MEKALIELDGKSAAVGDRVAKALSDWEGGTFEEEEVKDYFQHEWENGSRVVTERLASQMNIRRVEGMTALHEACCNGEVAMAKALLKMGAGVKAEDEWCETPLCKNFFARGHLQGAPRGHLQGDSGGFRGIPLVPPGARGHQGDPPESPWPQGASLAPGGTPGGGLNLN